MKINDGVVIYNNYKEGQTEEMTKEIEENK